MTTYFATLYATWQIDTNDDGTVDASVFLRRGVKATHENVTLPREPQIGRAVEIVTRNGRSMATSPVTHIWSSDIAGGPIPVSAQVLHDALVNIYT